MNNNSEHPNMLPLSDILSRLQSTVALVTGPDAVSFEIVLAFVELSYLLKPQISLSQSVYYVLPPSILPLSILAFLKASLCVRRQETVELLWKVFSNVIWDWGWEETVQQELGHKHISRFLQYGHDSEIGERCFHLVLLHYR